MKQKPLVFLTMPHGSYRCDYRSLLAWQKATDGYCNVTFGPIQDPTGPIGSPVHGTTTLRCWNFNSMWAMAWNARATFRVTHFAMLHDDIQAEIGWLDKLVQEQERTGADFVQAVVPFKDARGITSTGLGPPGISLDCSPMNEEIQRLTMAEVYQLPETFDGNDACKLFGYAPGSKVLLLNTGCWVCRFDRSWVDAVLPDGQLAFHFDEMNHIWLVDGRAVSKTRGEDWHASRIAHSLGCKLVATRKVQCVHIGEFSYGNWPSWGNWETDQEYASKQVAVAPAQDR